MIALIIVFAIFLRLILPKKEYFELQDHYDKFYVRLHDITTNEPAYFKNDILNIKNITKLDSKSVILDAGCGTGRHIKNITDLIPDIEVHGVDKSKSMVLKAQVRNPINNIVCKPLTSNIYNKKFTHIMCLENTLHHNSEEDIYDILINFNRWLSKGGYLIVHIMDPNKLDPGPRPFSQYFKSKDNTRHSLTYFEGFTHEAWWEKEKNDWYRYCEKFIFKNTKIKIKATPQWIPPVNKMIKMITRQNFKLKEIVELDNVEISNYNLYIFQK
jgi:SAM-dependent methyltransferase